MHGACLSWEPEKFTIEVVISPDSVAVDRRQEMALRPRIDGKFRSIKLVSPQALSSNENAPFMQNEWIEAWRRHKKKKLVILLISQIRGGLSRTGTITNFFLCGLTARYRFKHRIYRPYTNTSSLKVKKCFSGRGLISSCRQCQWVKVLDLFGPMLRAWEGPSSNPEPTALFFLFVISWYGLYLCYFFLPYNLSFFGDLIFTLSQELEPKTVKQKGGSNSVGSISKIAFGACRPTWLEAILPLPPTKPNQILA
jgi:hypothetical protein